ncbi:peptidase S8/S53 domain-containing protein [Trichoderma chlorosporum]
MASPVLSEFLKDLERYISNVDSEVKKNFRPTKVAIIDNGVLSITHTSAAQETTITSSNGQMGQNMASKSLSSRIKGGRSFVDDGSKLSSWLFASDPHGTQMANLICAMDPFCDLYVARVAERTHGITSARAARALKWALDQDVDIISMSISMLEKDEDLKNQVLRAKTNKVVIVCSTHDEGSSITTSYPAEYMGEEVIVVTACDEYGRTLRETNENKFDFMLRGKNVAAGVIPFIASSERISGSSVSTALTAGLSSLILTCHKLAALGKASTTEDHGNKTPADKVREHINNNMISKTPGSREILLEKFGGINGFTSEVSVENFLMSSFGMKG